MDFNILIKLQNVEHFRDEHIQNIWVDTMEKELFTMLNRLDSLENQIKHLNAEKYHLDQDQFRGKCPIIYQYQYNQ